MSRRVRWIVGGVVALLIVAGLLRLRFDTNVLGLLPADLPVVQGLQWHQSHFASAHELIITVSAPDSTSAEAVAEQLAAVLSGETNLVGRVLWRPPWIDSPDSAGEFLAWSWLQQDPEATRRLVDRLEPARVATALREAREDMAVSFSPGTLARLSYDPLALSDLPGGGGLEFDSAQRLFSSADGTYRVLFVEPATKPGNYKAEADWLAGIRRRIARELSEAVPAQVHIGYTGGPVFASEVASGMERDMTRSAAGTLVVIAAIFWLAHRRWRPLLMLVLSLGLSVNVAFAFGGLLLGEMNIISLGFAAILLGLVVDYGLVAYQERVAEPAASLDEIRRQIRPGILWSALTTAGAFLLLNLGGLPGLGQLGTLVALGVALGVGVMLHVYLPLAGTPLPVSGISDVDRPRVRPPQLRRPLTALGWSVSLLLAIALALLGLRGVPAHDPSPEALRPTHSAAFAEMKTLQDRLDRKQDPLFIITRGASAGEVADRLRLAEKTLGAAVERGEIQSFNLATAWWENPPVKATNRTMLAQVAARWPGLRNAVLDAGFATNALFLADNIVPRWSQPDAFDEWPSGEVSDWVFGQAAARDADGWFALGLITPTTNASPTLSPMEGSIVTGWSLLGGTVLERVEGRLPWLLGAIGALLAVCLWGAFRTLREAALGLATLGASLAALLAVMTLAGWSWNLLNLMALPLLFGTGVDYVLHVQMALRRHGGDFGLLWRTTGKALFLCGTTTVVGFGSLGWAGNAGLASLGVICATGVLCVMAVSLLALPVWWRATAGTLVPAAPPKHSTEPNLAAPASLYSVGLWKLALGLVRRLPLAVCLAACRVGVTVYRWLRPGRVRVVSDNLRPIVGASADTTANRLFDEFAIKLCDLWRYEAGQSIDQRLRPLAGWEHLSAALEAKRGVLLVTVHLGNWEFGAPLLAQRGIKLLVLTQPEPGAGFTELRQQARARWGIETFVVGDDPFAFVEIIRRLQDGECVALLVDRPPAAGAVEVELFRRPFSASISAAELARATGCAIMPVVLPRVDQVYSAEVLPPVPYDRAALGTRAARIQLTGEILRAFEPSLRQYPEQWFHFVPVWATARTQPSTTDGHR
jgi:predicted exporter/lauroyl/myristoyl acyltransferase